MDYNFFEHAKKIHSDKYDYKYVNYINSKIEVKIICPEHGEFYQTPYRHTHSHGCVKCSIKIRAKKKTIDKIEFLNRLTKIHNNRYDYSKSNYKNTKIPITIICPEHGEFYQTPVAHMGGQGCSSCANTKKSRNRKLKLIDFLEKVNKTHNNKYDYSNINCLNGVQNKVKIICPEHGEFYQTPHAHLKGCGCPKCGLELVRIRGIKNRYSKEEFINLSRKKHGDKYDYGLVIYKNNKTKVKIICKIHGVFEQQPENHMTAGQGCPICKESKGEIKIAKFLSENNINYEREKKFNDCVGKQNKLPFDFYLPNYNILIEYDGKQHFKPEWGLKAFNEIKITDKIKTNYAINNNIDLIRIPYYEKNIEEILKNKLTIYIKEMKE